VHSWGMPPVMFSVVTKYHKGRHSLFLYNLEIFCAFTQDILRSRDGFLGECNQRYWLLLRKEAQGFFRISFSSDSEASRFSIALISSGDLPD
ncbi:hypothetical protein NQ006_09200, partial [Pediococcus pentosaceus]|nr:hypothetical protein [Pediococcus pentosaceus]MCQ9339496.1 hypothetical protein [Pediococcus pentosaceus]